MRDLVYYVAVSLDGFIAGPEDQFDAFLFEGDHQDDLIPRFADAIPTDIAEQWGIEQPGTHRFGTVLMGWNTYAVGTDDPFRHLEQIVFSRHHTAPSPGPTVSTEDPVEVVRRLKREPGHDIWLCGGGRLAAQLAGEIDRMIVKHHPVLFGDGIAMFAPGHYAPSSMQLINSHAYASGVVVSEHVRAN